MGEKIDFEHTPAHRKVFVNYQCANRASERDSLEIGIARNRRQRDHESRDIIAPQRTYATLGILAVRKLSASGVDRVTVKSLQEPFGKMHHNTNDISAIRRDRSSHFRGLRLQDYARHITVVLLTAVGLQSIAWAEAADCFPWIEPNATELHVSPKKVFAHYFSPFPISLDDLPALRDYYSVQYLSPNGEGGKHRAYGGFLRDRPKSRAPIGSRVDFRFEDMKTEVRRAIAIGLDGFAFDVLDPTFGSTSRNPLDLMTAAAEAVDPDFKILLVPDMTAEGFAHSEANAVSNLRKLVQFASSHKSSFRLGDGRIVLAPFAADTRSMLFWSGVSNGFATSGSPVALVLMPVGGWPGKYTESNASPIYGASSWGVRTVAGAASLIKSAEHSHAAGHIWMAPVAPQDSRPRDFVFTESQNSAAFRAQWDAAISGGAEWVQLITWNDYSENSHIAPSKNTQAGFYNLAAYYTAWFKLGHPPPLRRDALYYFFRTHSMSTAIAPLIGNVQTKPMVAVNGSETTNEIELVGLLNQPGTLEIAIGGASHRVEVGSGLQSFSIPLQPGRPIFRLIRAGRTVVELLSTTSIDNHIFYQNPLYFSAAMPSCDRDDMRK